jgi:hypothetical protein
MSDIVAESGDNIEFEAGEEAELVCCSCGLSHIVIFNRDTTMQIWSKEKFKARKRDKTITPKSEGKENEAD